jgi:PST family polysaccharide transporter
LIVFGEKWAEAASIFQALAPAAILASLNVVPGWVFIPLGQTNRQLRATIFGSSLTVVGVTAGLSWGPVGVAAGFAISEVVKKPIQLIYACQKVTVSPVDILRSIWRPAIACIVAFLLTLGVSTYTDVLSPASRLMFAALAFGPCYLAVISLTPGAIPLRSVTSALFPKFFAST